MQKLFQNHYNLRVKAFKIYKAFHLRSINLISQQHMLSLLIFHVKHTYAKIVYFEADLLYFSLRRRGGERFPKRARWLISKRRRMGLTKRRR